MSPKGPPPEVAGGRVEEPFAGAVEAGTGAEPGPERATIGCSIVDGFSSTSSATIESGSRGSGRDGPGRRASSCCGSRSRATARSGMIAFAGGTSPRSHRRTDDDVRPTAEASCPRDMPFLRRDSRMSRPRSTASSMELRLSTESPNPGTHQELESMRERKESACRIQ